MSEEVRLEPMLEPVLESSTTQSSPAIAEALEVPGILLSPESADVEAPPVEEPAEPAFEEPVPDWRTELAAKMQNYRTRRKPRAPKYPSLQMPLQLPSEPPEDFETFRAIPADASRSSNALEPAVQSPAVQLAVQLKEQGVRLGPELVETSGVAAPELWQVSAPAAAQPTNLIEFPRSMESEAWDGLAEPMIEQPRILDAPALVPPEPALGGILLETSQEANPTPAADLLVRPASIARRAFAVLIDAVAVACALALWGWLVTKITQEVPPRPQLLVSAAVAAGVLGLSYQYLLMVYTGTTLGLRACRLELVALDGTTPGKKQRRWRLLASLLSATSVMLGYAWVLLDENRLCWHDRITHSYLRVRETRTP